MCEDVEKTVAELKKKRVKVLRPIKDFGYGLVTAIEVPGAGEMGLYQPKHPVAAKLPKAKRKKAKVRASSRAR
jgi:hypothetical protein